MSVYEYTNINKLASVKKTKHTAVNDTTCCSLSQQSCIYPNGESCAAVLLPGALIYTWVHFPVSTY